MRRWGAVGLGCITALGMQALFDLLAGKANVNVPVLGYVALFAALVLGGYVTGHFVSQFHALHGALAAVGFIFITTTVNALREAAIAREAGLSALAPIDFVQLTLTDVVAMTGASCGGWLAGRF